MDPTTSRGASHPDALGAYALGVLDADEAAAVEAHLAGCEECRAEVDLLSRPVGLLDGADGDEVLAQLLAEEEAAATPGDPADDLLLRRTLAQVRREAPAPVRPRQADRRPSGRPRLALAAAAAVVAFGAVGAGGVVVGRATAPERTVVQPPAPAPGSRVVQASNPSSGVTMSVTLTPAKGWTRISVTVRGVAPGTICRVVAVTADGRTETAGSWVVGTPAPGAPPVTVNLSAAVPPDDLKGLRLVTGEGEGLVTVDT